jgi:hypothetical protein
VFRLEPDLYTLVRNNGVTRQDIEKEYAFMSRLNPGFKMVNFNHAAYSAYLKKNKGKR